jgi:hypothetical protein
MPIAITGIQVTGNKRVTNSSPIDLEIALESVRDKMARIMRVKLSRRTEMHSFRFRS